MWAGLVVDRLERLAPIVRIVPGLGGRLIVRLAVRCRRRGVLDKTAGDLDRLSFTQ
jgi:hypothetical protein